MSEQTNKSAESTTAKIKTVIDDMAQRRMFDSTDEAAAYIAKCQEEYADFAGYPVAAAGLTEDGDFDPEVYNDDMRVGVYVLSKKGEGEQKKHMVHCIVIAPAPKLSALLGVETVEGFANSQGLTWLTGIIDKEINHVTVRQLRKAATPADIAEAVEQMPTTLADFITSGSESSSGVLETYNTLWQIIKKLIGSKSKPFALANLSKRELQRSMSSASYAATVYPRLELRKGKTGEPDSLFVRAASLGVILAKQDSLDPAIFERWLASRDEKTIDVAEDEDEFDLEAMAAKLKESQAAEAQAGESQADEGSDAGEDNAGE